MELVVRSVKPVAQDIVELELASPTGEPLPAFAAGAHVDLSLSAGLLRSYSLVNPQEDRSRYVVAVQKEAASRGGSRHVHEQLRVGSMVETSAPRNNFALVEDASLVVLIAGGIGITPLWCMVQRLEALGRPWQLVYAARSRARCAYLAEIEALATNAPGRVRVHIDEEQGGRPLDLAGVVAQVPADAHLYCCGPAPLLKAFEQATAQRPAARVHVEYFAATQAAATDGGFEVQLARSGRTVRVEPGRSILQTLLACGLDVTHACQEGVCGACQTTVLAGEPDHRDSYLSPQERKSGKTILLCCSGSRTPALVLDL